MGGKSKSSKTTTNQQTTNNYVNDGEFAGASDFVYDESDNSVEDSYNTDNSVELDDSFNTDNSVELDDSFNTEIDIETDIENTDSYNTDIDNSVDNSLTLNGQFAGATGDISILDGGAIDSAFAFGNESLSAVKDISNDAFQFGETTMQGYSEFNTQAFAYLTEQVENFSDGLVQQSDTFADELGANAARNAASNTAVIQSLEEAAVQNTEAIVGLAQTTATGGQDIIADSVVNIAKYTAMAFVSGAVIWGIKSFMSKKKMPFVVSGMNMGGGQMLLPRGS